MCFRSLFVASVLAVFTVPTHAATFVVNPGPDTIQDAIAQCADGDTVLVNPGRYVLGQFKIAIRKSITLKSVAGPTTTVLTGDQIGPIMVVYSTAGAATIQGFTIENGVGGGSIAAGGGILAIGANPVILENLIVANGAGTFEGGGGRGGGIAILDGSATIQRNTIVSNIADNGGLYLEGGAGIVDHNVIAFNSGDTSGGYGCSCKTSTASVHDNIFWANLPGSIDPQCGGTGSNLELDPRYCNSIGYGLDPSDWYVRSDSPLAPGHAYDGWGAPTGTCAATKAEPTTWGSLKSRYR